ncbi:MAG: sialidase family protein [Candidatus Latescibacterota bacterium]
MSAPTSPRPRSVPLPPGVTETTGLPTSGSIVPRDDGSLLLVHASGEPAPGVAWRASADGGRTWNAPQTVPGLGEASACGLASLPGGALLLYHGTPRDGWRLSRSEDQGATWSPVGSITAFPMFIPMHHSLVRLQSGRLLFCGYWQTEEPQLGVERMAPSGWGYWRGRKLFMEGHRGPCVGFCLVFHSDDEGRTWKQETSDLAAGIFGWFDERGDLNGAGGVIDLYEPTAAETPDGRVLLLARSKVGRLVQSYSRDGGVTWYPAEPTELASSQSPALLVRIPQSPDLLCVWNQVSGAEIRRGFLRGRLSAAASRDGGWTWEGFRTLELQADGMEDVARVVPEFPMARHVVGRSPFCQLPDGFAMYTYPNVDVVGDRVFVRYLRGWPHPLEGEAVPQPQDAPRMWPTWAEREAEVRFETVLRIYPVEWLCP